MADGAHGPALAQARARVRSWSRRRWFRPLAWALLSPLMVFVLFLAAANVMLWTGAIEAIVTRDGEVTRVELEHGFAWVVWPTHVHIDDARLAVDSYSYQLAVELEHAEVDIRLLSLLQRRAHFESITASGVRAQYRIKPDAQGADAPRLRAFPPFDGTAPEPIASTPKPKPAPGEAWGVDLDEVDAQVDALWIDEYDFEPGGHIHGGLHWVDGGDFSVPPTTVHADAAVLWFGAHEAVRALACDGTVELARFDSGEVPGAGIPAYLSLEFRGEGTVIEPEALATWWPQLQGQLAGEPGPASIDVAIDAGVLRPGSRVTHDSDHIEAGPADASLRGRSHLVLAVGDDGRPAASLTLHDAALHGGHGEMVHAAALRGWLVLPHGDLTQPWSIERVHAEGSELIADDLRRIPLGDDGWSFERGRGRGHAVLEIGADEIPRLDLDLGLKAAVLAAGSVRVGGTVGLDGTLRREPGGAFAVDGIAVRSDAVSIRTDGGKSDGTWVRLHDGEIHVADGAVRIEARAEVENTRPLLIHLTALDPLIVAAPELERVEPLSGHAKVLVQGELVEVEVIDSEQLGLHAAAVWRSRGEAWRMAVWLSGLTAFGFTATDDRKLRRPLPFVGRDWYREQRRWVRAVGGHTVVDAPTN